MTILYERNKFILAKVEPTYGADPSPLPAAGDAIETRGDLQIVPYDGPRVQHTVDRSTVGAYKEINVTPSVALNFSVGMQGSGTAATAAAYDALLQACGLTPALQSPSSGGWKYSPSALASAKSALFYRFKDGMRQIVNGARGNLQGSIQRGQLPFFTFAFRGKYAQPTTASVTPNTSDFVTPIPVTQTNTPTISLDGYTGMRLESFTFDFQNALAHHNTTNANEIFIADRQVVGQLTVVAEDLATHNWFTNVESHAAVTPVVFQLVHGATAGKKVKFDGPVVQMANITEGGAVDGISMWTIDLRFLPNTGNDEFTITTL